MGKTLSQYSFVLCFLSLFLTSSAHASVGVISLEALAERADLIVHGIVAGIDSSSKPPALAVTVQVAPSRVLKGTATEPLLVRATENMEDSPRFKQDQEVFLFLILNKDGSSYSVIGLIQGKFDVSDGVVLRRQMTVDSFIKELEHLIRSPIA